MRRTGNHGIIIWLEQSVAGPTLHINNIVVGVNGYRSRHYYPEPSDSPEYTALMSQGFRRNFTQRAGLICSYEDFSTRSFLKACRREPIALHYGRSRVVRDILLLRDPFNLFASRIKSGKIETKDKALDQKAMFIEHAETFLREESGDNLVCINFNRWFSEPDYRLQIQAKLGLSPIDVSTETVATQGGGSSFDGRSLNGMASKMDVLSRWRSMKDNRMFQALFSDGELARYSRLIFGDVGDEQM